MEFLFLPLGERPHISRIGQATHGQPLMDRWWLPRLWCLHAYDYHADLIVDGRRWAIEPGTIGVLAPATHQEYRYRAKFSRHLYCHFTLAGTAREVPVPVLAGAGAGPELLGFRRDFAQVAADWPLDPLRAEVRLWDLLWRLARLGERGHEQGRNAGCGPPELLRTVVAELERDLRRELSVAALARHHQVSHNHLTRLFRAHLGTTVVAWLRRRRGERALELLMHTDLPLADIGRSVGWDNPQHFNKSMRALYGQPPLRLRPAGAPV